MRWTIAILVVCTVLLPGISGSAQDRYALTYNLSQPMFLSGKVVDVKWRSPHVVYVIDAQAVGDLAGEWEVESLSPADMRRNGVERDTIKAGDTIIMTVYFARDGSHHAATESVSPASGPEKHISVRTPVLPPLKGVAVSVRSDPSNPKRYVYTVRNNSGRDILQIRLGEALGFEYRLRVAPRGFDVDDGLPRSSWSAPAGWIVSAVVEEDEELYCVFVDSDDQSIASGTTLQFSVEAEKPDPSYVTAPVAIYADGAGEWPSLVTSPRRER